MRSQAILSVAVHILCACAAGSLAVPALAGDGKVEISGARAGAGGVTPSDGPGFPATIDRAGSYVLTGNLVVLDPSLAAIEVLADEVTIDLNGFEIVGPIVCTGLGSAVTCSPGSANGISASTADGLIVHDGRVRGFGLGGVSAGDRAQVRNVNAEGNDVGISTGVAGRVVESTAYQNKRFGISVGLGSTVEHSVSVSNRLIGILGSLATSIVGSVARDNGSVGISCAASCVIRSNSVSENEIDGVAVGGGCTVSDNAAYANGAEGIQASDGSIVERNVVRANVGFGLSLSTTTGYRGNTITANSGGTVLNGVNLLANSCNGLDTCP